MIAGFNDTADPELSRPDFHPSPHLRFMTREGASAPNPVVLYETAFKGKPRLRDVVTQLRSRHPGRLLDQLKFLHNRLADFGEQIQKGSRPFRE